MKNSFSRKNFDVLHRRIFFVALSMYGKNYNEIFQYMASRNLKKTEEEIEMFYNTLINEIRSILKMWHMKLPNNSKYMYQEFIETYVSTKRKNDLAELTLLLAHEEMKKIGYTSFQKHPNRIPPLIKLINLGSVTISKHCKRITLKIPSSSVIQLHVTIKDIKKEHIELNLAKYPRIYIELRPKNILITFMMKKLYLNPYVVIELNSKMTVNYLKTRLIKYWNLGRNLDSKNMVLNLTHSCKRINTCYPFYHNKCDLFDGMDNTPNKSGNNTRKIPYNILNSEIDCSNTYMATNTTSALTIRDIGSSTLNVDDIVDRNYNIECCGRSLNDDEILVTLIYAFYDPTIVSNSSENKSPEVISPKCVNHKSSTVFYYSFSGIELKHQYDNLSAVVYKSLIATNSTVTNNIDRNDTTFPKIIENKTPNINSSITSQNIPNVASVDKNTPSQQIDVTKTSFNNNASSHSFNLNNSMSFEESNTNFDMDNNNKILPPELSTNEFPIDMLKNYYSNNLQSQYSNSSFSRTMHSLKSSESKTSKSFQRTIDGPTNFAQLAALIKEGGMNFTSSPAKRDSNDLNRSINKSTFQPSSTKLPPKKFAREDDSVDMTKTFQHLIKNIDKKVKPKSSDVNTKKP